MTERELLSSRRYGENPGIWGKGEGEFRMEAVFRRKRQGVDGLETGIFRREDEEKFVVGRRVAPRICPYRCNRTEGERQESRVESECESEEPSQTSTFRDTCMVS
jgi:hypothetical protein